MWNTTISISHTSKTYTKKYLVDECKTSRHLSNVDCSVGWFIRTKSKVSWSTRSRMIRIHGFWITYTYLYTFLNIFIQWNMYTRVYIYLACTCHMQICTWHYFKSYAVCKYSQTCTRFKIYESFLSLWERLSISLNHWGGLRLVRGVSPPVEFWIIVGIGNVPAVPGYETNPVFNCVSVSNWNVCTDAAWLARADAVFHSVRFIYGGVIASFVSNTLNVVVESV